MGLKIAHNALMNLKRELNMRVFITEKADQALNIGKVLGLVHKFMQDGGTGYLECKGALVTWCIGHLLELYEPQDYDPKFARWSMQDLPIEPAKFKWRVKKGARKQFGVIQKLLEKATEVVIATDYDREGELIGRNLIYFCKFRGRVLRLKLNALDDLSIKEALANLQPIKASDSLYAQALARTQGDWLMGINFTRLYSSMSAGRELINIGRVITATVGLVVKRDLEIENFLPYQYYQLQVSAFDGQQKFKVNFLPPEDLLDYDGKITDPKGLNELVKLFSTHKARVTKYELNTVQEYAPLPFSQTKLQIMAGQNLNLRPLETLHISQALYDSRHRLISYPRTDCEYLPTAMWHKAPYIMELLAQDKAFAPLIAKVNLQQKHKAFDDRIVASHPHHALMPSFISPKIYDLSATEFALYDSIRRSFVALFYPPAVFKRLTIILECQGYQFKYEKKLLLDLGYKEILNTQTKSVSESDSFETYFPKLKTDDEVDLVNLNVEEKTAKAPPHFTEISLISAMLHVSRYVQNDSLRKILAKTQGIGTEDTRALIVEKMQSDGWVRSDGHLLLSTPKARLIIENLPEDLKSPEFTALREQSLEQIAQGSVSFEQYLSDLSAWLHNLIAQIKTPQSQNALKLKLSALGDEKLSYFCEKCKEPLIKLRGKYGVFFKCSNPNCGQTYHNDHGKPQALFDPQNAPKCQLCGQALKRLNGKFGYFWRCSNQDCNATYQDLKGMVGKLNVKRANKL